MKTLEEILENKCVFNHTYGKLIINGISTPLHSAFINLPDSKTAVVKWSDEEFSENTEHKKVFLEHVSVSPKHKCLTPTWNDMAFVKDVFFYDTEEAYQIHPTKSEYVNIQNNCLHIWRRKDGKRINE